MLDYTSPVSSIFPLALANTDALEESRKTT